MDGYVTGFWPSVLCIFVLFFDYFIFAVFPGFFVFFFVIVFRFTSPVMSLGSFVSAVSSCVSTPPD